MRISDWSSDVCSSDLIVGEVPLGRFRFGKDDAVAAANLHVAFRRGRGLFHFGGHVLRLLVLPQPKETRVAHRSARGEFGEGDFGDDFGFQPMDLARGDLVDLERSDEHTAVLQSLMHISYAVFCVKKQRLIETYK